MTRGAKMSDEQQTKSKDEILASRAKLYAEAGELTFSIRALPGVLEEKLKAISECNKELSTLPVFGSNEESK
jgi:hypothetical protein